MKNGVPALVEDRVHKLEAPGLALTRSHVYQARMKTKDGGTPTPVLRRAIERVLKLVGNVWFRHTMAAVVIAAAAAFMIASGLRRSPTVDEGFHLVRGTAFWATGDARLSHRHPPVSNALYALPFAILFENDFDFRNAKGWDQAAVAYADFARADYERTRLQIMVGRIAGVALAALFLLYFYRFCTRFFGWLAAICALVLLAFNPTLLAHARLFTTDFPVVAALFVAAGELIVWITTKSLWRLLGFALAAGAALGTKYSAIPVVGFLGVVALVQAAVASAPTWRARGRNVAKRLAHLTAASVLSIAVVNASYGFDRTLWTVERILAEPEPPIGFAKRFRGEMLESTAIGKLPRWLVMPLPFTYVWGAGFVAAHNERGHSSWFLGEKTSSGDPYYFPLLILLKTPTSVWALLLAGVVLWTKRRDRPSFAATLLLVTALTLLLMLTRARMNIGVRHGLMVVPLLTALAGLAASQLLHASRRVFTARAGVSPSGRRWATAAAVLTTGAVAFTAVAPLRHFPDYLGYFNLLVGREMGHRISIVGEDWGQDAVDLAAYAREHGLSQIYYRRYVYGGTKELSRHGIKVRYLACRRVPRAGSYAAIHAVDLARSPKCFARLVARSELQHVIHNHIYVYRVQPKRRG